jgi:hypothetical protein
MNSFFIQHRSAAALVTVTILTTFPLLVHDLVESEPAKTFFVCEN